MRIGFTLGILVSAGAVPGMAFGGTNTPYGDFALDSVTTGVENSAFGAGAGEQIRTTSDNTLVGFDAMVAGEGFANTAVGVNAGYFNYGSGNTAVGIDSLGGGDGQGGNIWEFDGSYNVALGAYASAAPSGVNSANYVTSVGAFALYQNQGSYNTAIGGESLYTNLTGTDNTAVGEPIRYFVCEA